MMNSSRLAIDTLVVARTVLALSAILAFVAVVSACDAETPAKASNVKVNPDTVAGDSISLSHIGNNWKGAVQAEKTTGSVFVVPMNYGHVKLWFYNKGTAPVTVSVKHVDSGKIYFAQVIPAGEPWTWRSMNDFPEGVPSGIYSVSYHSGTADLYVEHSGFASDSKDEVKN